MKSPFTRKFLLKYFCYDKEEGKLYWINHWNPSVVTKLKFKEAGTLQKQNHTTYRILEFNYNQYSLHRIIWFLEYNEWCELIDHIDGNGLNNKITNLRKTTSRLNARNLEVHRKGRLQGVHFCKCTNKWRSQITVKGKRVHLGRFETEKEAYETSLKELKARGLL